MRVSFKSTPDNWWKEYMSYKRNTVRKQDDKEDHRFELLERFIKQPFGLDIEIIHTENASSFTAKIKDVTKFEGLYIISW